MIDGVIVPVGFQYHLKETQLAADVAGCRAVGNVKSEVAPPDLDTDIRNKTLGFGGNVLFITSKVGPPSEGVAYRCN